jgi:hypothetical protein
LVVGASRVDVDAYFDETDVEAIARELVVSVEE